MQYLSRAGLTMPVGGETFGDAGDIYYEVTNLGNKVINAHRLDKNTANNEINYQRCGSP